MKPTFPLLCLLILFAACSGASRKTSGPVSTAPATPGTPPAPAPAFAERPKNIIFLIGDGMALAQATASVYWMNGKSNFEKFPVVGFHKPHAANDLITDSAAGATAFACGQKTNNAAIGMLPDNTPCRTILEDLDAKGWATGMVVTCSATHATPACFIAHQEIRAFTDDIANDYLKTALDCYVGGGAAYFNARLDGCNLFDSLENRGYVVRQGSSFKKCPLDGSKPFYLFTAPNEPGTASAGRSYLPSATRTVCEYLAKRSPRGFFLMVEGSQIDWAGHSNDRAYLKAEMLDFEKALGHALAFAAANGETLVVVSGDHECGGLSIGTDGRNMLRPVFATKLHTGALVPVYAFGPKAELFSGIYENTAIHDKMLEALGVKL